VRDSILFRKAIRRDGGEPGAKPAVDRDLSCAGGKRKIAE
jgi:hypothetical protein